MDRDPYPMMHGLRTRGVVHWNVDAQTWLVTGYQAAVQALSHVGLAVTENAHLDQRATKFERFIGTILVHTEPPAHARIRHVLASKFDSEAIGILRPQIKLVAQRCLERVRSRGEMDVVSDFGSPLTTDIMGKIIGIPQKDRQTFASWCQRLSLNAPQIAGEQPQTASIVLEELWGYIVQLAAERKARPQSDLISHIMGLESTPEAFNEDELVSNVFALFIAGHETTRDLISNVVIALLNHPGQLARVLDEPGLIARAVDEVLRYNSPLLFVMRKAVMEIEIAGQRIRPGELVCIMLGAANRDPSCYNKPDQFDIDRPKRHPLSFGYGIHFCLGSLLAQTEAVIGLRALLALTGKSISLRDGEPQWRTSFFHRGVDELAITFDPRR
jgi:cytochrome P450